MVRTTNAAPMAALYLIFVVSLFVFGWLSKSPPSAQANALPDSFSTFEAGFEEVEGVVTGNTAVPEPAPLSHPKVGIQAGHYKNDEVPEELSSLQRSGAGAVSGPYVERDIVYAIAERAVALLKENGIDAELLPAKVPKNYQADAFVSIHADASADPLVSGFKIAASRFDEGGEGEILANALYASYESATGLPREPTITRHMRGYYAFNFHRYEHSIHPHTPGVIIETGYVTSEKDRAIIVANPDQAAEGILNGIMAFLAERNENR